MAAAAAAAGSSAAVTVFDPSVYLGQIAARYKEEFEEAFVFTRNGTLRRTAADIARFDTFLVRWESLIQSRGLAVQHVQFEQQGQADVAVANRNKLRLLQVYGVYYLVYQEECKFLRLAPNPNATAAPDLEESQG